MSAESASPERVRRAVASNCPSTVVLIRTRAMPILYHRCSTTVAWRHPELTAGASSAVSRKAPRNAGLSSRLPSSSERVEVEVLVVEDDGRAGRHRAACLDGERTEALRAAELVAGLA